MLNLYSILAHQRGIVFRMIGSSDEKLDSGFTGPSSEGILILPEQGQIKVVNEVGARIWSLIDGQLNIFEIAERITEEYQVGLSEAQKDTLDFLIDLEARGLVVEST